MLARLLVGNLAQIVHVTARVCSSPQLPQDEDSMKTRRGTTYAHTVTPSPAAAAAVATPRRGSADLSSTCFVLSSPHAMLGRKTRREPQTPHRRAKTFTSIPRRQTIRLAKRDKGRCLITGEIGAHCIEAGHILRRRSLESTVSVYFKTISLVFSDVQL